VAPFFGQCNLRFLSTEVLQCSVGTCANYDKIFIDYFTANLLQSVMVKEFWKSVRISPDTVYILSDTRNQCKSQRRWVTWSYFRAWLTRRSAALRTDWRRFSRWSGTPDPYGCAVVVESRQYQW